MTSTGMMVYDDAKVYGVSEVLHGKRWCKRCVRACWVGAQGDRDCVRQYWTLEASGEGGGAGWPIQLACSKGLHYLRERNTWRHSLSRMGRRWGSCFLHLSSHQGGTGLHTGQHSPAEGHYCPLWRTIPGGPHAPHTAPCWYGAGWAHLRENHCGPHTQANMKHFYHPNLEPQQLFENIEHNIEVILLWCTVSKWIYKCKQSTQFN